MEEPELKINRGEIISRGLVCRCPNCGEYGLLQSWFHLRKACHSCQMDLTRSAGFYSGTTSIGYVASIIFIILPVIFLVINQTLTVRAGILLSIFGSMSFIILIYPLMLCWMVMVYHVALPGELPANSDGNPNK
jgi:uncharacterized protein (DUF983 family)